MIYHGVSSPVPLEIGIQPNNLSIFSQAQVMSFQYLLGCTLVPGVSINSNLGLPSLSFPLLFCPRFSLSFTLGEQIKLSPAQPSSAGLKGTSAEGPAQFSSSCRKRDHWSSFLHLDVLSAAHWGWEKLLDHQTVCKDAGEAGGAGRTSFGW